MAYKTDLLKLYGTSASEIRNLKYPKIQNMTSYEFHDFVTYNLEEVLATIDISVTNQIHEKYYGIHFEHGNVSENTKDTLNLNFDLKYWTTQRYKTFGRCFSFKVPHYIQRAKVLLTLQGIPK